MFWLEGAQAVRASALTSEQAVRVEITQLGFDCLIDLLTRNNLALLILVSMKRKFRWAKGLIALIVAGFRGSGKKAGALFVDFVRPLSKNLKAYMEFGPFGLSVICYAIYCIVQLYAFQIVIDGNIATLRQSDTVYLLDSSIYIFQAWFGYPDRFHDEAGRSVNAVYGYLKTLLNQIDRLKPQYMLAAFDESLFSGFRHGLYPDYKANRALPDDSLARQLHLCRALTELLGICCAGDEVYEADDWLALGAYTAHQAGLPLAVLSRDKDLAQLIGADDLWWDWSSDIQRDYAGIVDYWGVRPQQIPDLLALMGDSSDNIPGVSGVGEKSARILIQHFDNLENLFANLEEVKQVKVRGAKRLHDALLSEEENVFLFRELIRLHPPTTPLPLSNLKRNSATPESVLAFMQGQGLGVAFQNLIERHYA